METVVVFMALTELSAVSTLLKALNETPDTIMAEGIVNIETNSKAMNLFVFMFFIA
jgi:hypothetical protein